MPPVTSESLPDTVFENKPGNPLHALDTSWELRSQFGTQLNVKNVPVLIINSSQKTFGGSTGCNRMSGTFTIDGAKIKFNEEIITTKMACDGYNENGFINTLLKVNAYKVQDSILELSQNDIVLLSFKRK